MKITFVLPGYPWTPVGGFRVVYEYGNELVARGYEVTVVHPRFLRNIDLPPARNIYRELRRRAGHLRGLLVKSKVSWQPIDKRVDMLYVPEPIARHIPDADVVFATAWRTAEYVIEYPVAKGRKFYLVQDFEPYLGPKTRLENTWRKPFKKVAISYWLYEKVLQSGVPKRDVALIQNGIDLRRFRLIEDIDKRPKRIAMMYSRASYKAPEDGIEALEICKVKQPDLQAFCFGPNPRPKSLPLWIEYGRNIREDELLRMYNRSMIYLCCSLAEGFALPPAEAMACGCAIVSTDCGGNKEYCEHGVTGLLSLPKDPEALAKNAIRLLEDDDLRIRLARAGYERIQQFTWERSVNLLEQFITGNIE